MSKAKPENTKMKIITINVPMPFIGLIETWIQRGFISSRSEFLRTACYNELLRIGRVSELIDEEIEEPLSIQMPISVVQKIGAQIGETKEENGRIWEYRQHGWTSIGLLKPL